MQNKLDEAYKLIAKKDTELCEAKLANCDNIYNGSCVCKNANEHNCEFRMSRENIDLLNETVNDLKVERETLGTHAKKMEGEAGECSLQLESVRKAFETKLEEKKLLQEKAESAVSVKDELLAAKQEIIEHLKETVPGFQV